MLRVSPAAFQRFRQTLPGTVEVTFAGAEANTAVGAALLGCPARFVSALPGHAIADACVDTLRGLGVDTSGILRTKAGRLGVYFAETGANQRPSSVIYDREGSSIARSDPSIYDWEALLGGAAWFHITGITPALSQNAAGAALDAVKKAHEMGLTVSCDLNYRKKLWNWAPAQAPRELAREVMARLLPYVDVLIGNEEDSQDVLGIKAGDTDVSAGKLDIDRYPAAARQIVKIYPNIKKVATTLRESVSATHNNWGAMLYDTQTDACVFAPQRDGRYAPYEIRAIVDRIGGGDSFGAGLIYGFLDSALCVSDADVLAFAAAASCLCHSISGDFNYVTREEVLALMAGDASGRVKR
jgi:2-dehydro-3-deoxygluconokinase